MSKVLILAFSFLLVQNLWASTEWISEAKKGCKGSELCAVGTGESITSAERNARVELSKIFDTKISSKLASSLKSSGKDVEESVSEEIDEATETALSGVEIKKTHEDKTSFFALAALDKSKAAAGFKKEIENLDSQMLAISKEGESIEKVKLEKLFVQREVLNKQYHFLTRQDIPAVFTYEQVFLAKKNATNEVVIHIYLEENEPKTVEAVLLRSVSDLGFKTSSGQLKNKNATHVVTGEYVAEQQFLKVEGFEKYKFVLKLRAMKAESKVESGHLNFEVIETGRDFAQASEKAIGKVQDYVKKNIEKLHLK